MTRELQPIEKKYRSGSIGTVGMALVLGIALYWNSLNNEFVYDDKEIVLKNRYVQDFANFPKLFTRDYFEISGERTYRPLTTATVFLDYAIWDRSVWGHRLTNILLHSGSAVLLYFCILAGIRNRRVAFFGCLLFLLHPANVEAVSVVSNREDSLALFFGLLGYRLFIESLEGRRSWAALQAGAFVSMTLALLSKETALCFPILAALHLWMAAGAKGSNLKWPSALKHLAGPWAMALVFPLIRYVLFPNAEGAADYPGGNPFYTAITMPNVFYRYVAKLISPARFCADYDMTAFRSLTDPGVIGGIVFLAAFVSAAAHLMCRRRWAGFWLGWILVGFLPVSNIVPFGALMADRYMYVMCVGFCGLAGSVFAGLFNARLPQGRLVKMSTLVLFVFLAAAYGLLSFKRTLDWRSSYSIWKDAAVCAPNSSRVHNNFANALAERNELPEALREAKEAVRIDPNHAKAFNTLGYILQAMGDNEGALDAYRQTVALNPDFAEAYYNASLILIANGDLEKAENALRKAIQIEPFWPQPHFTLGNVFQKENRMLEAEEAYRDALALDPNYLEAIMHLGIAQALQGKTNAAVHAFRRALDISPGSQAAMSNLSFTLTNAGRCDEAVGLWREFAARFPDSARRQFLERAETVSRQCAE